MSDADIVLATLKTTCDIRLQYLMICRADDLGKLPEAINILNTQAAAVEAEIAVRKAETAFLKRIGAFFKNPNTKTFVAMRNAFSRFMTKTVSDDPLLAATFESEYASIRAEWAGVFERYDNGEALQIGPHMWPWQDTEAEKRAERPN